MMRVPQIPVEVFGVALSPTATLPRQPYTSDDLAINLRILPTSLIAKANREKNFRDELGVELKRAAGRIYGKVLREKNFCRLHVEVRCESEWSHSLPLRANPVSLP